MKALFSLLSVVALALMFIPAAFAEPIHNPAGAYNLQVFNQYTGLGSTARYSNPIKIDRNTRKTAVFAGYSTNGTDMLTNLPGTVVLQCGATSSGPWVTSKDIAANAISATTSTIFAIDNYCQWYRIGWTKTGSGKRSLSAWILYGDAL